LKTKAVRCLLRGRSWKTWASAMLRSKHSLENQGGEVLFAELSVDHRGRAAPAAEAFD